MTPYRDFAADLVRLASDTPPTAHDDATEHLLAALRQWAIAHEQAQADDYDAPTVRALELLLAAVDAARVDTGGGGVRWMAAVVRRLADCQGHLRRGLARRAGRPCPRAHG